MIVRTVEITPRVITTYLMIVMPFDTIRPRPFRGQQKTPIRLDRRSAKPLSMKTVETNTHSGHSATVGVIVGKSVPGRNPCYRTAWCRSSAVASSDLGETVYARYACLKTHLTGSNPV
jgi:hypothetical protein